MTYNKEFARVTRNLDDLEMLGDKFKVIYHDGADEPFFNCSLENILSGDIAEIDYIAAD